MKRCRHCGKNKRQTSFRPRKDVRDGLRSWCRDCEKEAYSQYLKSNPERARERNRRYRHEHPEWAREQGRKSYRRYKQAYVDRARRWIQAHPEHHADQQMRRRVRLRGNRSEPYSRVDVFKRDGYQCHLCSRPIDPALSWPDLECASIDHVLPVSKGGADALDNVKTAHLSCNIGRGAALVEEITV